MRHSKFLTLLLIILLVSCSSDPEVSDINSAQDPVSIKNSRLILTPDASDKDSAYMSSELSEISTISSANSCSVSDTCSSGSSSSYDVSISVPSEEHCSQNHASSITDTDGRLFYRDNYERKEKYIVFFLTNTSASQARSMNLGKDSDTRFNFISEIPHLFGTLDSDSSYKYAFGLPGPMLLTQSISEMNDQIRIAFDAAEKYDVPVYFQLDDCNNYTTQFGSAASPKFYNFPQWCEWISFLQTDENWGGERYGRLPYFWFNWGQWMRAEAFPCFESDGFRQFVTKQLTEGVLIPLNDRLDKLRAAGKEYLFAGMAIGWETHIPDYSTANTILNVKTNRLPVNILKNDQMQLWEASRYGYNALHIRGKDTYDIEELYDVIHDYSEFLAKTAYDSGIPKEKIYTHIVGFMSAEPNLKTTFAPPIYAAVNSYSTPGFTLSPETCPYDLDILVSEIRKADPSKELEFANAEGYSRGIDGSFEEADEYFRDMFNHGASLVSVFGWGIESTDSAFAVSHSPDSSFVKAAKKWLKFD